MDRCNNGNGCQVRDRVVCLFASKADDNGSAAAHEHRGASIVVVATTSRPHRARLNGTRRRPTTERLSDASSHHHDSEPFATTDFASCNKEDTVQRRARVATLSQPNQAACPEQLHSLIDLDTHTLTHGADNICLLVGATPRLMLSAL
jgi:hypothetical protein